SPDQALNVFDFEAVARQRLPTAHLGYMATGTDDDETLEANREAFNRFQLRVRRLVDVRQIDMSVTLFGTAWPTPIILAPVGSLRAFDPDGERATARAAKAKNHLQILSTQTGTAVEDVIRAREAPVWFQLYATDQWSVTQGLVKRAQSAGCPVMVWTVDLQGGSNRETATRAARRDTRQCNSCHRPVTGPVGSSGMGTTLPGGRPMFTGLDMSQVRSTQAMHADWDFAKRLRDATSMKFLIKGIVTREDAELAVEHGVDGVIVSNHGGRGESSGRGTIESLVEVVEGVKGRIPVIVDGGFRRGTDIFKALALGASAIMIGRPYVWGLASFGQPGVEAVLDILQRELRMVMRQAGTVRVGDITRAFVVNRHQ
ncbi:MAG TPA: alpha-hydroxy acid oxidase, partial [Vicinamibacterales bacterium]|nr:alpha-hydroxy acid oxidase [Vicinamibacterales bacterium]